jgi:hypothetical protein
MAAIKASVNLFELLDGDDPGDRRQDDFGLQHKDQPKKKPAVSAAVGDYKLKLMKQPSPPAPAARSKAPMKSPTPGVFAGLRSAAAAPKKNTTSAVAAGFRSGAAASMNKQTTTPAPPPARNTNLTNVLFAYPSARERIFKQRQETRQEEYERRQAKMAENGGSVSGDDDSKSAGAGAPSAVERTGKTHGVKVQKGGGRYYYDGAHW